MLKFIFFILLYFFNLSSHGQTYSDIISDNEITSFLKWEVKNSRKYNEEPFLYFRRRVSYSIFEWQIHHFEYNEENYFYGSLFSKENGLDTIFDKDSLVKQFFALKTETWSEKIKGIKFVENKKKYFYKYSIPLFTKNRNFVILKKEFFCGNVCAYGGVYLYKRVKKNKWEKIKEIKSWVS